MLGQPPSGGCVLKQVGADTPNHAAIAAAFGRLCVETTGQVVSEKSQTAAAFGRLCVETPADSGKEKVASAAAFGWLCVETCRSREIKSNV